MKLVLGAVSVMVAVCILDGACAGTWYVDSSVPKAGDGTSWQKAFKKIQSGIDKAAEGDTVIVAQGTYVENARFKGRNIVLRSKGRNIVLRSTDPTKWSVVRNTIIDGNRAGSVVVFAGTENETCVLSGFTIRNGSGTLHAVPYGGTALEGGGIFGGGWGSPHARATVQNNIVTANTAADGGGINGCYGLIQNNILIGNTVTGSGGAICGCSGTILNNVIAGNSALGGGGGAMDCGATLREQRSGREHCGARGRITSGWDNRV